MSMDCFHYEQFYLNVDKINHKFIFELAVHTIAENFSFENVQLYVQILMVGSVTYDLFIALFILDKICIYSVKSILHLVFYVTLKTMRSFWLLFFIMLKCNQ